jgi:hypothetical protein
MLQRVRLAGIIAVPLHLVFAIPDCIDNPQHRFFIISARSLAAGCLIVLVALTYTRWGARRPLPLASFGFFLVMASLATIMSRVHHLYDYADGFGLYIIFFCFFVPMTMAQTVIACLVTLAIYIVPAVFWFPFKSERVDLGGVMILIFGIAIGLVERYIIALGERYSRTLSPKTQGGES